MGNLNLFIKMIREDYKLDEDELERLRHRLLADDREFEKVWGLYKNKSADFVGGVDKFKSFLLDFIG